MNLTLRIWRQKSGKSKGRFETYTARDISEDMSFMETLDLVNEDLILKGEEPIAFDSDCREGICGTCCIMINCRAHGGKHGTTVCQLHMREFRDGDTIIVEPLRARAFPIRERPHRGPLRSRRNHQGRRIYIRGHGQRTRCQRNSRLQRGRGSRHGCRRVHRLWGVRRLLQERRGRALRLGQARASLYPPPGKRRMAQASDEHGPRHGPSRFRRVHQRTRMRVSIVRKKSEYST